MTDLVVAVIDFLINFFNTHIPAYDLDVETYNKISNGITSVIEFITDANFIIPLSDIVTIIMLTLGIRLFKFSLFAGNWIVNKITDIIPL